MIRSLDQNCPRAHIFILCMDKTTYDILIKLKLPYTTCIPLSDIEDEALLTAKVDRGVAEYCWTLAPCLPWFVLQNNSQVDLITYLDADLLFYSSVEPIFDEIGNSSIAIIEHRFASQYKELEVNGIYCVEWVSFRRNKEGMACLSHWRDQCIEWCYYRLEEGRMGDQKYLDEWPIRYVSCHVIQHVGAGIAPWNYSKYSFGQTNEGEITVNGELLIFYHFHHFELLEDGSFDRLTSDYTSYCPVPSAVYRVYEDKLMQILKNVHNIDPKFSAGIKPIISTNFKRWLQRYIPIPIKNILRHLIRS